MPIHIEDLTEGQIADLENHMRAICAIVGIHDKFTDALLDELDVCIAIAEDSAK